MTPFEKIDFVFFYIKDKIQVGGHWGYNNIWNYVERTPEIGINKIMFDEIIKKLKEDGYITEKNIPEAQPVYNMTFKGLLFNGYNQEYKETQKLQQNVASLSSRTFWLTVVIALGTLIAAIYYLIEIWKSCSK
jgi:hypothetical protein